MNSAINTMLNKYNCRSVNEYENALKEIIQEIALLGLWRAKFFERAAFYGGSALRIMYGLDRFSEDLDFSLLKKDKSFSLADYCKALEGELKSFGFIVMVEKREKKFETNIESAFIKGGTLRNMIVIDIPESVKHKMHPGKAMKIKLEVDTEPPGHFHTEAKYLLQPIPFSVNTYALPSLFAGKMHAVLCRSWGKRVKGRDWYDLVWYVGRDQAVSLKHLGSRMRQTGHLGKNENISEDALKKMLIERIKSTNFNDAKKDVENLLGDPSSLDLWSEGFFREICERIKALKKIGET